MSCKNNIQYSNHSMAATKLLSNRQSILMVDDERDILVTIKLLLQNCGFSSDTFIDPYLALEHFKKHSQEYSLVISDIRMPVMTGFEFIQNIRSIDPDIKILVITASENVIVMYSDSRTGLPLRDIIDGFIQKPISAEDLCKIIEEHFNK